MYSNFKILDDYNFLDNQKETFQSIEKLFEMKDNNLSLFGNLARKTLENIFARIEDGEYHGSLNEKIILLKNENNVPTNVLQALYNIKNITNRESHGLPRKSDIPYHVELTNGEAEIILRSFWLFLKWVLIYFKDAKDVYDLSYKEKSQNKIFINEEFSNNNNSMKAEKLTLAQLIFTKGYKFNIPTYQRDYEWKKDNVKKLFKDIVERKIDSKTHYFGSLAIAIDRKSKIYRIIDGQQRISTSLLLFKAFYDTFKEKNADMPEPLKIFVEEKLRSIYINQDILSSQKALSMILKGGIVTNDLPKQPLQNFNYFKEELLKYSPEDIWELFNTFSVKFEVATLIFQTAIDNEMDIFENLNTGGIKLENWDLIRSYIFSKVNPKVFLENEELINKELNNKILALINPYTKNKSKNLIASFFTLYNRINFLKHGTEIFGGKENSVYHNFKNIWMKNSKMNSFGEYQEEISKLNKELKIFLELKYPYTSEKLKPYAHIISFISSRDDFLPILVMAAKKYCDLREDGSFKKIKNEFIKIIRMLESYLIRSNVYGNKLDRDVDKFLIKYQESIYENLWKELTTNFSVPMGLFEEFKQLLITSGSLSTKIIVSIMRHLELYARNIQLGKSAMTDFESSHEHIIAQNLKFKNYDDNTISEEKYDELQNTMKDSIGNALLLSRGDNSKAGNKSFAIKKEIYSYSSKVASELNGIMNLLEKKTFTFDDVKKRAKQIAEFLIKNKIYFDEEIK